MKLVMVIQEGIVWMYKICLLKNKLNRNKNSFIELETHSLIVFTV